MFRTCHRRARAAVACASFAAGLAALLGASSPRAAMAQAGVRQGRAPGTVPLLAQLDAAADHYGSVARQIWSFAEVGFQEVRSSALLQQELAAAGFAVKAGVAGEPTAFVAEFGSGEPVIALLGEFDALPGMSQDASPTRQVLVNGGAGHACGHHLFGTGSVAAAVALKAWMVANKIPGTLRVVGTPAEEGGAGKVFMVRDGLFDDVDAVVAWHPSDENAVTFGTSKANVSGKFTFHGVSSHASISPERGRSALDAVEIMNVMANYLREHVPEGTRIHYVITDGGRAPNVVPEAAQVYYQVRHRDMAVVKDVWARVIDAAKGAALGTGTTFDLQIIGSVYAVLPNETLARVQQRALERVGGFALTEVERAFAVQLQQSPGFTVRPLDLTSQVRPLRRRDTDASTDVGDVSWVAPTVQVSTATWVPGTATHSWQAVAAGGMSIGTKGMMVAAKVMALTAAELFTNPTTLAAARAEFEAARGAGFRYTTLLGDQPPALDYRKGSVPPS